MNFMLNHKPYCHISIPGFCNNYSPQDNEFWMAKLAFLDITQGPLFVDNPLCVRDIVNYGYWYAYDQAYNKNETSTTTTESFGNTIYFWSPATFFALIFILFG